MKTQSLNARLAAILEERKQDGSWLDIRAPTPGAADFGSNDYLGLARPGHFQDLIKHMEASSEWGTSSGATGSRILTGNHEDITKFEKTAAEFHGATSCVLMNSGYDANLGLFSCLPAANDVYVYDELVHASIHDGMRMSLAQKNRHSFRHNDVKSLEQCLERMFERYTGSIIVAVDAVYSMDGDVAPLKSVLDLVRALSLRTKRDIHVIVDEAHSVGIFGENGQGLVFAHSLNSHPNLLATVITYGKAFGAHGAVILGSPLLRQHIINNARPLLFSTAPSPHSVLTLAAAYSFTKSRHARQARAKLWRNIRLFKRYSIEKLPEQALLQSNGQTAVQTILVPGVSEVRSFARQMLGEGFDVWGIHVPAVPLGSERLRVVIHAHNSENEIRGFIDLASRLMQERLARL